MHGVTANTSKDWDPNNVYINEQGWIMFARCSLRYQVDRFWLEIVQNHKVHSKVTLINSSCTIFPNQLSNRYWNSLLCCSPSLDKKHLIDIYHALYTLMGNNILSQTCNLVVHSPGSICITTENCSRDFLVGRIPIVPTEQAVTWLFDNTPFRYNQCEYSCVLPADFTCSVDHSPLNTCLFKVSVL